jgi:hypothetical protein
MASRHKSPLRIAGICLVIFLTGFLASVGLRYATYNAHEVHHHANFALYVNGVRDEFKSFTFYEEVQACASDAKNNPRGRVHMHNQNKGLVHVHAAGVTWGHFFANLGYGLTDKMIQTDAGIFTANGDKTLTFTLNGQSVSTIANQRINSTDKLLINYGNEDSAVLRERFDAIQSDAAKANGKYDPAACSGGHDLTPWERFKRSVVAN